MGRKTHHASRCRAGGDRPQCDPWLPRGLPSCGALLAAAACLLPLEAAEAASCKDDGGLRYLGNTAGDSRSVWLSATTAGAFALDAAQGNQTVDTWSKENRGLHVSLSPVVSKGSGGTHKLYETGDGKPCLIDTQNQKKSFNFPDFSKPPQGIVPPIGNLFPDFGGNFPGGTRPPAGQRPPTGLMPTRPGGVTPPIGMRPPTGVMPTRPGGPGTISPPIATLPPTGVMPTRPGAVTPPIGTRPPGGLSPGRPGSVTPPIGTLPPGGVTPGLPGVTQPPTGPGQGGGGGGGSSGGGGVSGGSGGGYAGGTYAAESGFEGRYYGQAPLDPRCIDPRQRAGLGADEAICPEEPFATEVPITPGRDLGNDTPWNAWVDTTLLVIDDERFGNDTETTTGTVTLGLDRAITDNIVAGGSIALQSGDSTGFDGTMESTLNGFTIGPYVAFRLSDHWALDASATYSRTENDLRLSVLKGDYVAEQYAANVNLHGQYDLGIANIRPKGSLFYGRTVGNAYEMKGEVLGRAVTVAFPESRFDYGAVEAATEINKVFYTADGLPVMPYAEIGGRYDFERPNDGQVLTGDLTLEDVSPWAFSLRSGVRMMLTEAALIEASAGYLSFGQQDLDIWEGRLYLSFGF